MRFHLISLLLIVSLSIPSAMAIPRPKLILVVVFDQFRADYLTRFEKGFLPPTQGGEVGGFRYLMERGAYFPDGEYDILQSMTCPGHATILTGALPYLNGIPSNFWFDQDHEGYRYCAEDPRYHTVGAETLAHVGTSPRTLNSSTVGDELKNAGLPSKVVTLALKDRAAIMMGGHRPDLALWFDTKAHQWVSSDYYLPEKKLPDWMKRLNEDVKKTEGKDIQWLSPEKAPQLETSKMIFDSTLDAGELSKTVKTGTRPSYAMPYGAELTEMASERAFDAYNLGRGQATDLFAVSFSGHDYAGHAYGPNSREMAILTQAEDRELAKFLNFVKKRVPLGQVTIVLTADHGIPPNPDWLAAHQIDAGRIEDPEMAGLMEKALDAKFGKPKQGEWVAYFHDFSYFLNRSVLRERGASLGDAETIAKTALENQKGVAYVFTSEEYRERRLPPGMHQRQILNTYYPARSGDVVLIPQPFWMKADDTVDHITGYSYDRTVPLILAGFGIKAGIYSNRAAVIDIAPTLSFLSGVVAPSLSEGHVLSEALKTSQTP